eukprot:340231-Prorocentrum_minimum.AAC.1
MTWSTGCCAATKSRTRPTGGSSTGATLACTTRWWCGTPASTSRSWPALAPARAFRCVQAPLLLSDDQRTTTNRSPSIGIYHID